MERSVKLCIGKKARESAKMQFFDHGKPGWGDHS